jgi:hypothetical protein
MFFGVKMNPWVKREYVKVLGSCGFTMAWSWIIVWGTFLPRKISQKRSKLWSDDSQTHWRYKQSVKQINQ